MKIQKIVLTVLSLFGVSMGAAITVSDPVQAAVQQCNGLSEEECCQLALERNSIEALEEFLRIFPPGRSKGNTACSALAMSALSKFGGNRDNSDNRADNDGPPQSGSGQ
jgi:hypothetical protein